MKPPFDRRRKTTCSTCGYLTLMHKRATFVGQRVQLGGGMTDEYAYDILYEETPPDMRGGSPPARPVPVGSELHCLRRAFPLGREIAEVRGRSSESEAFQTVIEKERACPFWFKYRRGFAPELHRDLEVQESQSRQARLWGMAAALIGALIGAGATIAGFLIERSASGTGSP